MRKDKAKAFKLREQGKSYKEIQNSLQISRGTLSEWFKNEIWSEDIKKLNISKNIKVSTDNLKNYHLKRTSALAEKYNQIEEEAQKEFNKFKNDPLFMAGLMVYATAGDKTTRHLTKVSNSEFYIHIIFIRFAENFLGIPKSQVKVGLVLYPSQNIEKCLETWSKKLKIDTGNFNKTQVTSAETKLRKLQFGIGNSMIISTGIKVKMLKWLELCELYFN